MIRSFLPIDLLVLLLQGGLPSNAARTRDKLGGERAIVPGLAGLLVQSLNPRNSQRAWVWVDGLTCRGLASIRNRCLASAWEVDCLVLHEQDMRCCCSLLEMLAIRGGELGVEKIFLRLAADSPLVAAAKEAGFVPYVSEYVYAWESGAGGPAGHRPSPVCFPRVRRAEDLYRLFELYQKCVPIPVRRVQGMTLREWEAARERGAGREWVFEKGESLVGWLRTNGNRGTGRFEVMATEADLEHVLEYGFTFLRNCRTFWSLVPEYDRGLARLLEERGFKRVAECSAMAKQLVVREQQACLMPVSA